MYLYIYLYLCISTYEFIYIYIGETWHENASAAFARELATEQIVLLESRNKEIRDSMHAAAGGLSIAGSECLMFL